jgi:predicted N-acetyltransferase YhbS
MQPQITINERPTTAVTVRQATTQDTDACARIFYDSFESIATRHSFPIEPPSREFTHFKASQMLSSEGFVGFAAERNGELVGTAFVDERDAIAGIGPVTVDPAAQDDGIGRALMEAALARERGRRAPGIRLGPDRLSLPFAGALRKARLRRPRAPLGDARHTTRDGCSRSRAYIGLGILVPTRNANLLRWGLEHRLRIVQQSTLMTTGLYNEPAGAYLPSILY